VRVREHGQRQPDAQLLVRRQSRDAAAALALLLRIGLALQRSPRGERGAVQLLQISGKQVLRRGTGDCKHNEHLIAQRKGAFASQSQLDALEEELAREQHGLAAIL
jgi:hypothetical protein